MSASIEAVRTELESAKHALKGASDSFTQCERELHEAQAKASRAYEGRAANARNVDRLTKALELLEGGTQ